MLFILFAESKLCLKDLSDDITDELIERLQADEAALENFYQFFGLKLGDQYPLKGRFPLHEIKKLFPDTTVSVLKKCFEVLRLYDLTELLEKVKPRSLRPAVSPEQIEKLRRADNRPTKYHSDVAVLVVDFTVEMGIVEREDVKKIETFFKDLNSRNEVAIISLARSQETRKVLRVVKERRRRMVSYQLYEEDVKTELEIMVQRKVYLEKTLEVMRTKTGSKQRPSRRTLSEAKQQELKCRGELENVIKKREQAERDVEKLKELEKEITKPMSTVMDEWIHNQGLLASYTYKHDCIFK